MRRPNQQQLYSQGAGRLIILDRAGAANRSRLAGLFAPINSVCSHYHCDRYPYSRRQPMDQANVFLKPIVVIVGAVRMQRSPILPAVWATYPISSAPPVFIDGTLDLVGGSGRTPDKAVREAGCGRRVVPWSSLALLRSRRRRRHSNRGKTGKLRKITARTHRASASRLRFGSS
jgi:hypothetical protein